jgi:hypothetical protein
MTDLISRTVPQQHAHETPAYSAMQECLRVQFDAEPRGWFARLIGRTPLNPDARGWFSGALGERDVDHVLAELGSNWTILRDASDAARVKGARTAVVRSDVARVVVGPPGIFTITTRNFDGQRVIADGYLLTGEGQESDGVRIALGDATRAGRLLAEASRARVEATPLLVVTGAASIRLGKDAPAVDVVGLGELRRWLLDRARMVSDETVAYFSEIALRSGHWNKQPAVPGDVVRLVQRFERLQKDIVDARRRSRWVILGGTVAVVIAVVVTLAALL